MAASRHRLALKVTAIAAAFAASLLLPATTLAQATDADPEDPKTKGWRIFTEAREAAGAGPDGTPLRDYTFQLRSTAVTPKGKAERRSKGYYLHPRFVRQEIDDPVAGVVVVIFDGKKLWQVVPGDIRYMPDGLVDRYRIELDRSHLLLLPPPPDDTIWFLRQEEVAGRLADVIELRDVGGPPVRLFVDVETRDVVKKMFVGDVPDGGMAQVEEFYANFQDVGGYRWPFYKKVVRNGKTATESITLDMQVNVGLTERNILR